MQLLKDERKYLMAKMFRHLDGIATGCTIKALMEQKVTNFIEDRKQFTLSEIGHKFGGNAGYLNVGLRILENQGWLETQLELEEKVYKLSSTGAIAFKLAHCYQAPVEFIPVMIRIQDWIIGKDVTLSEQEISKLKNLIEKSRRKWDLPKLDEGTSNQVYNQLIYHLDGLLIAPIMVSLAMKNIWANFNQKTQQFSSKLEHDYNYWDIFFEILALQNWMTKESEYWQLTPQGSFVASKAYAYGVTVSYLPMFAQLKELLFGEADILSKKSLDGHETHVDRMMNIWASSRSHKTYSEQVKKIIVEIFNQPLSEQPLGIAEMGCGDGTLLKDIYEVITEQTVRGKVLAEYPLIIVGADYNQVSLETTRLTLENADVPNCTVLFGNINNPDDFAKQLWQNHDIRLQDLLSIRAFIDHNRHYQEPKSSSNCPISSTGTFACQGKMIPNHQLIQNLIEHLKSWRSYVEKFGLLILELNIIPPKLVATSLGKTLATPYDATQGYTDQYPVELPVFMAAAKEAGLVADPSFQTRYPPSELATVSINYFKSATASNENDM
ncbi:MAG: class I SAM-dependent methyltransferase [Symploca sp. SIO3E6]|nr:class I SAM-dependent methyltransferase [Caldora sp. SIO3E6]